MLDIHSVPIKNRDKQTFPVRDHVTNISGLWDMPSEDGYLSLKLSAFTSKDCDQKTLQNQAEFGSQAVVC